MTVVERAADVLAPGQQHVVLHVEDAGGVVGALEEGAELREVEGIVAQHGVRVGAVEQQRAVLHPLEQPQVALADAPGGLERAQLEPGVVERLPHVGGQRGAHGAGVAARGLEARQHARRVVGIAHQEIDHALGRDLRVLLQIVGRAARRGQRRGPLVALAAHRVGEARHALPGGQDAGDVLRALHVAREPEEPVGGATEHVVNPRGPRCPWFRRPGSN